MECHICYGNGYRWDGLICTCEAGEEIRNRSSESQNDENEQSESESDE